MKKTKYYKYIGHNGTITSQVLLDNVIKIDMYRIVADEGKVLTNGEVFTQSTYIYVNDLDQWSEVDEQGQD